MRRSVAAPETGAGARVAARAVAPAVPDAPEDTAVLVGRAVAAATAEAGIAGTGGRVMAARVMAATAKAAGAATTGGPPATRVTGTAGGRATMTTPSAAVSA